MKRESSIVNRLTAVAILNEVKGAKTVRIDNRESSAAGEVYLITNANI